MADEAMAHARILRLAHTLYDECARALKVESAGDGVHTDTQFKLRPLTDGGVEMDFAVPVKLGESLAITDGVRECVRVTVRPLELF